MPQVKVNFGPKVGGAKKTFPPEKKAPAGLASKPGKVNPFLKNDAAKKQPASAEPAPEKPAQSKEVTVDIASKPEIKVELPAPAPIVETQKEAEPEAPKPAPEPEKPKGSKSSFLEISN